MWRGICGNKVLARVQLVLFMNKFDRLKRRLQSGDVLVKDHVQSFGNRSNDYKTVSNCECPNTIMCLIRLIQPSLVFSVRCGDKLLTETHLVYTDFRASFSEIHRKYSPAPGRGFFAHFTTAVVRLVLRGAQLMTVL